VSLQRNGYGPLVAFSAVVKYKPVGYGSVERSKLKGKSMKTSNRLTFLGVGIVAVFSLVAFAIRREPTNGELDLYLSGDMLVRSYDVFENTSVKNVSSSVDLDSASLDSWEYTSTRTTGRTRIRKPKCNSFD
jgi:hypothetical protein